MHPSDSNALHQWEFIIVVLSILWLFFRIHLGFSTERCKDKTKTFRIQSGIAVGSRIAWTQKEYQGLNNNNNNNNTPDTARIPALNSPNRKSSAFFTKSGQNTDEIIKKSIQEKKL